MKLARSCGAGTLLMSVWYGAIRKLIPITKKTKSAVIASRGVADSHCIQMPGLRLEIRAA